VTETTTPTEQIISEQPEQVADQNETPHKEPGGKKLLIVSLAALGIVYGDIGTSPLYALRACFVGVNAVPFTSENIFGVLSLILWSLVIVISIKYMLYVMRADNRGEGGILALMALLVPPRNIEQRRQWVLLAIGIFGAALLYGDGMITPAISVLSAIEGLELATPVLNQYHIPLTIMILILLFLFQQRGTAGIGAVFGPIMLVWFSVLAVLGLFSLVHQPGVLVAVNPLYAVRFFAANGWHGFLVLGAVFLVVTGGEALYADMGHFGRRPIRVGWFGLVLPALLLNYFGQGAFLLGNPEGLVNPFYLLAPRWALYPMVLLATIATVIASQAVISGAFSLTRQAVLLGFLPRLRLVQTSREEIGQIYIPAINWLLMIATIVLVLGFRTSNNLTGAYGVAVATTMVITTILAYEMARKRWGWNLFTAIMVTAGLLTIDLAFFGSNMLKIEAGGWVPLLIGVLVFTLMTTWKRGRTILREQFSNNDQQSLADFLKEIIAHPPHRVPGTAVFMTGRHDGIPVILQHHLKHNQVLHEQVILLTVIIEEIPRVSRSKRLEVTKLDQGFFRVVIHFGFMESPNVPQALRLSQQYNLKIEPDHVTYYIGRQTIVPNPQRGAMALWRKALFVFLARNAAQPITFYHLSLEQVFELGIRVEF
jgi:KUP system potassium uptake protein